MKMKMVRKINGDFRVRMEMSHLFFVMIFSLWFKIRFDGHEHAPIFSARSLFPLHLSLKLLAVETPDGYSDKNDTHYHCRDQRQPGKHRFTGHERN